MTVQISAPVGIAFTESAAKRVYGLMLEEGNPELKLRVYIEGGGCSGFQYGFTFDEEKTDDDMSVQRTISADDNGEVMVELLIDPLSFQYLVGAEIDYVDDIEGERFVIRNPNAQTTCGCGSSFSV